MHYLRFANFLGLRIVANSRSRDKSFRGRASHYWRVLWQLKYLLRLLSDKTRVVYVHGLFLNGLIDCLIKVSGLIINHYVIALMIIHEFAEI